MKKHHVVLEKMDLYVQIQQLQKDSNVHGKQWDQKKRCKVCCSYEKVCTNGKCEISNKHCAEHRCITKVKKCKWTTVGNTKMKKCCSFYQRCIYSMKTGKTKCDKLNNKCQVVSKTEIPKKLVKQCHSIIVYQDFKSKCSRKQCCMYMSGSTVPQSCKFVSKKTCVGKKPPKRSCSVVAVDNKCTRKRCCSGSTCKWVGKAKCDNTPIKCTIQIGKRGYKQFIERICCRGKKCNTQIRWCFETAMVTVDTVMAKELCQGIAAGDLEACLKIAKCSIPDKSTKCLTGN